MSSEESDVFTDDEIDQGEGGLRYTPLAKAVEYTHHMKAIATIKSLRARLIEAERELAGYRAIQEAARVRYDEERNDLG
jgi:hypothetical protein